MADGIFLLSAGFADEEHVDPLALPFLPSLIVQVFHSRKHLGTFWLNLPGLTMGGGGNQLMMSEFSVLVGTESRETTAPNYVLHIA